MSGWKLFLIFAFVIAFSIGFLLSSLNNSFLFTPRQETIIPSRSATPTPAVGEVSMVFVGDIMLSRSVGQKIIEQNNFKFPFLRIADYLKSFDLAFANLENPVSSRGTRVGSIYSFRADPRTIEGLTYAGLDVVSIANNHIWDYGRDAFIDTLTHLTTAGIGHVGGGYNYKETHAGVVKEVDGVKIGFLAYTNLLPESVAAGIDSEGVSYLDIKSMKEDIVNMHERADIVITSFHWGEEYKTIHNANQEYIAKEAIAMGADLVIGHHPHVRQEVVQVNGSWVAYSLGNFIFDQSFSKETTTGSALEVKIKDKKIESVQEKTIYIWNTYQASLEMQPKPTPTPTPSESLMPSVAAEPPPML